MTHFSMDELGFRVHGIRSQNNWKVMTHLQGILLQGVPSITSLIGIALQLADQLPLPLHRWMNSNSTLQMWKQMTPYKANANGTGKQLYLHVNRHILYQSPIPKPFKSFDGHYFPNFWKQFVAFATPAKPSGFCLELNAFTAKVYYDWFTKLWQEWYHWLR